MAINEDDIVGKYTLDNGDTFIFLRNRTVFRKKKNGDLIKIELNKKNIKAINEVIDTGKTDVVR